MTHASRVNIESCRSANVSYELQDNAFAAIDDWEKAQQLSDGLLVRQLHTRLDAEVLPSVRPPCRTRGK